MYTVYIGEGEEQIKLTCDDQGRLEYWGDEKVSYGGDEKLVYVGNRKVYRDPAGLITHIGSDVVSRKYGTVNSIGGKYVRGVLNLD